MSALKEFTLQSKSAWRTLVEELPWQGKDIYYLPEWYATWEESGHGQSRCLYAEIDGDQFLYPFLLREIEGYDLPRRYYDIETAYGYGGVVVCGNPPLKSIQHFNRLIDEWLAEHSVVTELVRLSPLLNHVKWRQCDYFCVRKDVFLDVPGKTGEQIWTHHLSSSTRNKIRKGEKKGLITHFSKSLEKPIDEFIPLYYESAARLKMDKFYWFSEDYFKALSNQLGGLCFTANVTLGEEVVSSSIWLQYDGTVHYFLAATGNNSTKISCSDAYFWAVISRLVDSGDCKLIHFGGGLSNDINDSLFRFKAKYGNRVEDVFIGRRIHLPEIYESLSRQWENRWPSLVPEHGHKLLKYRLTGNE